MQKQPKEWTTQLQLLLHVRPRFLGTVTSHQSELNFVCCPRCPDLSLSQSVRSFSAVLEIRFIRMTQGALAPSTGTAQLLKQPRELNQEQLPLCPSRHAHPLEECEKGSQGHQKWGDFLQILRHGGKKLCVLARSVINNNS